MGKMVTQLIVKTGGVFVLFHTHLKNVSLYVAPDIFVCLFICSFVRLFVCSLVQQFSRLPLRPGARRRKFVTQVLPTAVAVAKFEFLRNVGRLDGRQFRTEFDAGSDLCSTSVSNSIQHQLGTHFNVAFKLNLED